VNLTPGDISVILGGAIAVGYGAVKYATSQSLKAINLVRSNDLKHIDEKVDTLADTVKEQHEAISKKVDEMSTEMTRQFGKWDGLELGERVTHLERQAFNGPEEGASEKARRQRKAR